MSRPIRAGLSAKLLTMSLAIGALGLVSGSSLLLFGHFKALRAESSRGTHALLETVGEYCIAPLVFDDDAGAREMLSKLRFAPAIQGARLYDAQGKPFAEYGTLRAAPKRVSAGQSFVHARGSEQRMLRALAHQGARQGALYVEFSTRDAEARGLRDTLGMMGLCLLALLGCALVALRLQRFITVPISRLVGVMDEIGSKATLTTRVQHHADDEIGALYHGLNGMLDQLEKHQRERQHSESRLHALLEVMPDTAVVVDEEGTFVEALTGPKGDTPSTSGSAQHSREPASTELPVGARDVIKAALANAQRERHEFIVNERTLEAYAQPLPKTFTSQGKRLVLWVTRDITDRRSLELQLRQAQKMEAVGQLAGGVAHDFNNMLMVIMGRAELAQVQARREGLSAPYADDIISAAKRSADLVSQLLTFSRQRKSARVAVDLHAVVERVATMLRMTIDPRIEVVCELLATAPTIEADLAQMESVLLNLSLNARDAMPEGGRLVFTTQNVSLRGVDRELEGFALQPGDYLEARVSDTGQGMTDDIKRRIFEPFFTTKPVGKGTGLGLAVVYGTLHSHGGAVTVVSKPGDGTSFRLLFPLTSRRVEADERPLTASAGRGRLLVVDDEQGVLELTSAVLQDLGYEVIRASNGAEAVDLFRKEQANLDLVILDMVMPKLNGRQAAEKMREIDSAVSILFVSGYSPQHSAPGEHERVLFKPFTRAELAQRVALALSERPRRGATQGAATTDGPTRYSVEGDRG